MTFSIQTVLESALPPGPQGPQGPQGTGPQGPQGPQGPTDTTSANLVAVYANNSLVYANANINFNNTSTINVSVTANTTNKRANIDLTVNSSAITFLQGGTNAVSRTIQSRLREGWISVKDFGALGDGAANDTIAVQDAINYANTLGGGVVYFPEGTYNLSVLNYQPGITFQGEGGNSKLFKIAASVSFSRMFTITGSAYTSSVDSKPVIWRDLYFDGNSSNQTPFVNYEKEHDHMIFLSADTTNPGRLRSIIQGCVFENTVADAVSVYTNVNLEISDCIFRNCFRGSVVVTGGYSIVKGTNIHASGSGDQLSRIDIEIDGAGYNSLYSSNLNFTNIYTQYGFDLSGQGMIATLDNITTEIGGLPGSGSPARPYGITIGGANTGNVVITNSRLVLGEQDTSHNRIVEPGLLKFENCQIIQQRNTSSSGAKTYGQYIYWGTNNKVTYQDCEFFLDSVQAADTANGITSLYNVRSSNNTLIVDGCQFYSGYDTGVYQRGGTTVVRDTIIDAVTPIYQDNADASGWELTVDNMQQGNTAQKWMHILTSDAAGIFKHKNCYANVSNASVTTDFGYTSSTYRGFRVIQGSAAPTTTTFGFPNDRFILETPGSDTYEWVHTGWSGGSNVWASIANDAYTVANAAGNLVAVYANNTLAYANANINFNNSATINVSVSANTTNKRANVTFSVNTSAISATGPQGPQGPQGPIGGSNTQILFNNNGTTGGSANLTFNLNQNLLAFGTSTFFANATSAQVGVGVTSPLSNLHIRGLTFRQDDPTVSYGWISTISSSSGKVTYSTLSGGYFTWQTNNSGSDQLTLDTGGNLGINVASPTSKLHVSGNANITGNIISSTTYSTTVGATNRDLFVDDTGLIGYVSSNRDSKKNIESLSDVDWLLQLDPVTFNRRIKDEDGNYTEEVYSELEYGLIAEDVEQVNDKLVFYDQMSDGSNELRGVHYSKLIAPMLKLIQNQNIEINNLKQQISNLESKLH